MNKNLIKIKDEYNNINRIMTCIQNRIKKYTELNSATNCLLNNLPESIILYNIKHSKNLHKDMDYFRTLLKCLNKYKIEVENIISEINSKLISILDKQNKKNNLNKINELIIYNNNYQILYTNIEEYITNINNIRKYYVLCEQLININIPENNFCETDLGKKIHKNYFNKYYNRNRSCAASQI